MADKCCFNINPISAPACKSSRLKDACVHLKTVYIFWSYRTCTVDATGHVLSMLRDMYCQCYRTCTVNATGHVLSQDMYCQCYRTCTVTGHVLSMLQDMYCQCYRTCTVNAVRFDETPFMWWCEKEDKKA